MIDAPWRPGPIFDVARSPVFKKKGVFFAGRNAIRWQFHMQSGTLPEIQSRSIYKLVLFTVPAAFLLPEKTKRSQFSSCQCCGACVHFDCALLVCFSSGQSGCSDSGHLGSDLLYIIGAPTYGSRLNPWLAVFNSDTNVNLLFRMEDVSITEFPLLEMNHSHYCFFPLQPSGYLVWLCSPRQFPPYISKVYGFHCACSNYLIRLKMAFGDLHDIYSLSIL